MSDGEEWKGEPEQPEYSMWLPKITFGPPLTPEQMAELEMKWKERRAKGRMLAATLTRYREDALCSKCGSPKSRTWFCEGKAGASDCVEQAGDVPHMHRVCKRCTHTWYELPLDAETL